MVRKKSGGLAELQRATDLLSGLVAQEAKDLAGRRRTQGGDIKALKEITAVLKDLAAVARSLGEQSPEEGRKECGVVLLPEVCAGKEESD